MKILNAVDAKKEAMRNISNHAAREAESIFKAIERAVSRGQFHIAVKGSLELSTIEKLKRSAYSVEWNKQDGSYTIAWGNTDAGFYNHLESVILGKD